MQDVMGRALAAGSGIETGTIPTARAPPTHLEAL